MSNASGGQIPAFPWAVTKGNYGANWGNCDYGQGAAGGFFTRNLFLQSPFGITADGTGPITIRMASVTDGTSNTHFCSELLQGVADSIFAGTIWVNNPGGGTYMTRFTPNGYRDYVPMFLRLVHVGLGQRAGQRQRGQPAVVRGRSGDRGHQPSSARLALR